MLVNPAGRVRSPEKIERTALAPPRDAPSFLAAIGADGSAMSCSPAETVFRQGDPADAVYYLQKGKIRLTVVAEHGKEAIIAMLDAGQFFGEGSLAGQPSHVASAAATAPSVVVRIESKTMARLLDERPSLSALFLAHVLSRNAALESDLVDQLFNSSEQRLARLLLLLADFAKDGKMEPVIPLISQHVLAARVGTTRSRINFFMNKFRKLGFIEYDGGSRRSLKVHPSLLNVILRD